MTRWGGLGRSAREQAEALGFDAEGRVEFAAEVLQRDRGGQLDDLRLAVMLLQSREECIIDILAGDRHALGVFERDLFSFGEQRTVAPCRDFRQSRLALITV